LQEEEKRVVGVEDRQRAVARTAVRRGARLRGDSVGVEVEASGAGECRHGPEGWRRQRLVSIRFKLDETWPGMTPTGRSPTTTCIDFFR
jgi:hypothetical protein